MSSNLRFRIRYTLSRARIRALNAAVSLNERRILILQSMADALRNEADIELDKELSEGAASPEELDRRVIVYAAVGQTLSSWARMENSLITVVSLLLETTHSRAGIVMYSVLNFGAWIQIIDDLIALDSRYLPLKPKWNKIGGRLRGHKDTRDRLAHHSVHYSRQKAPMLPPALRPSEFDLRQKSKK